MRLCRLHFFFLCKKGATAIEFALLAPVLFLLLMGIIELGCVYYATHVMENATAAASRWGMTGSSYGSGERFPSGLCPNAQTRTDFIKCSIDGLSKGLLDPNKVQVRTQVLSNYQDIDPNNYQFTDADKPCFGASNQAVIYRVTYEWKMFTPLIGQFFGDANGNLQLRTTALIKNENYGSTGPKC